MAKYRKTVTAIITGLIGWAAAVVASSSKSITAAEWVMLATVIATALGVYAIPNAIPSLVASSSPVPPPATPVDGGL